MNDHPSRRGLMAGAALLAASAPGVSWAFERDGSRKVLVFSGNQAVPVLDPHVRYDWSTRMIQQSVYDALLKYEGDPPRIVPWLAERYEASPDGLTYTFHLVGNAKFHNGDPVDAEAVRFSFERGLKLNAGIAWMLKDFLKPEKIVATDPRTVTFTLERPFAPFISLCAVVVHREPEAGDGEPGRHRPRPQMDDRERGGLRPIQAAPVRCQYADASGSGAGLLEGLADGRATSGCRASSTASSARPAPRKAALQRREVDIITNITPDDIEQLARVPGVAVENHKGSTTFGIKFNCQEGPTADINLRKAIAFAFDYDAC